MKVEKLNTYIVATPKPHIGGMYWIFLSIETKREITESASYVKNLIEDRLNDVESQWSFYIRGHDLEWFICDKNKFNGRKFRDSLTKFVKYDDIKIHSMFQSLDKWRIENNVPELFA